MANVSAICTSFKTELATGTHNFTQTTGDVIKVALYTSAASLGAATTVYAAANEVSGTGYSAGGVTVTSSTPIASGTTTVLDFTDPTWTGASFTANAALIYNSSKANRAIAVFAFGGDQTVTASSFVYIMPTPDASNAVLRLA